MLVCDPRSTLCVFDWCVLTIVQSMQGNNMTFGDVSNTILNKALKEVRYSRRMDIVFDVYQHISIKNTERVWLKV